MKLLSMIAAAAVAVSLAPTVQAADLTGTLAKIDKSGEIVIGHRESSVPFAYLDENQKPIDYSMDLCAKIVDAVSAELGKPLNVKYVPVNPKTRIALMANGTKLMVRKGSGITSVKDLAGKAVALAQGTTNERAVKAAAESMNIDFKVLPVRDHAEGMLSLETDRVDAYATDHILLYGLMSKSKNPDQFEVVGDFLSFDPYALMVRRDDSAFELIGKKTLAAVFRSSEIDAIYDKWFKPLGVPQTDLLKAAFKLGALPE